MLESLRRGYCPTGNLAADVPAFLNLHGCPTTAAHCADVAAEARRIAARVGVDVDQAENAGWLHDVSVVFPAAERATIARQLGLDVLPEEDAFPMIIHQKLSVVLSREIFGVTDAAVLSAVGCHTTLKPDASLLDKVVFVADKIAWDQAGDPPFLADLLAALAESIDQAALAYLQYLWDRRDTLRVVHPWMRAAYWQLKDAQSSEH